MKNEWIAFAGVIIGSCISILGAVITAQLTMRSQIKTAALNAFLTARIEAYRDYEIASERLSNERSHEAIAAFYRAVNTAALVASDETIQALGTVLNMVREYEIKGTIPDLKLLGEKNGLLTASMRQDLLTYPIPTPISAKNHRILRAVRSLLTCRHARYSPDSK